LRPPVEYAAESLFHGSDAGSGIEQGANFRLAQ
jgi:hypothetical protein